MNQTFTKVKSLVGTSIYLLLALLLMGSSADLFGQAAGTYAFSTSTGAALDPMTGATTLLGTGNNNNPSGLTNIGFTFNFAGTNYTQFSLTPDGFIKMGSPAAVAQPTNDLADNTNVPIICPLWDNAHTGTNGGVTYVVTGAAGNRILKIQWFVRIPNANNTANSTFQCWLYETTNVIEFRYGTINTPPSSSVGIRDAAGTFHSVTISSNTTSTVTVNNANAVSPASGRMYRFVPPCLIPVSITGGPTFCGASGVITAVPGGGTAPYTYAWNGGATTAARTVTSSGTYTVSVTDAVGCSGTVSLAVTVANVSVGLTQTPSNPVCSGSAVISTTPNGCSFSSYNVTTIPNNFRACGGNAGPSGDDATSGPHNIGFTFNWFGTNYTQFGISTNGNIQFGAGAYSNQWTNATFPNGTLGASIALAWDDFNAVAGEITWGVSGAPGSQVLTVCFNNLTHINGTGEGEITQGQIQLYEGTNVAEIHMLTSSGFLSATQGFQLDGGNGTTIRDGAWGSGDARRITPVSLCTTYAWSNGANTPNITVNAAGNYTVTITNAGGCTATATQTTTFNPTLTASITGGPTICASGTITAVAGGGSGSPTYVWTGGATTASITVNTSGTYTVTISDAGGCTATASTYITVVNVGVTLANSPAGPYCGNQSVTITPTVSGLVPAAGARYYIRNSEPWNRTDNVTCMNVAFGAGNWISDTYTINPATLFAPTTQFVFLEGSDANALAMSAFVTANITLIQNWVSNGGRLFMNAGPNQGGGMSWGFGGVTLTYPSFQNSVNATDPTHPIYLGPNTPVSTSYTATSFAHGTISGGGTTSLMQGGGLDVLTFLNWGAGKVFFGGMTMPGFHTPNTEAFNFRENIIFNVATSPAVPTYAWSNGSTTSTITVNAAGTYVVTVTFNGCTATASTTLNYNPGQTVTVAGGPVFCGPGTLTANTTGGTAPYTYAWTGGATTASLTVNTSGAYTVTVTDASGCVIPVTVNASVFPVPTVTMSQTPANPVCGTATIEAVNLSCPFTGYAVTTIPNNFTACGGNAGPSGDDVVSAANNIGFNFTWYGTTYTQFGISTNGNIQFGPGPYATNFSNLGFPNAVLGPSIGLVWDDMVADVGDITWGVSGAPGSQVLTVCFNNLTHFGGTGSGNITQGQIKLFEGTNIAELHLLTSNDFLSADQGFQQNGITGTSIRTNTFGSTDARRISPVFTCPNYLWSNGATTPSITVAMSGTYSVTTTNANGCTASASQVSVVNPAVTATITGGPTFCGPGVITAVAGAGTAPYTYSWTGGATTAAITVNTTGTYTVTISDASGCTATASVAITIATAPTVTISTPANPVCGANVVLSTTAGGGGGTLVSFSRTFTQGVAGNAADCSAWNTFLASLTGTYTQMRLYSNLNAGITLTDPATAQGLATALNLGTSNGYAFGGNNYQTGVCGGGMELSIDNGGICTCNSFYALRPCVVNTNWGGISTATCSGPTQTITLEFTGPSTFTYLWSNGATTPNITVTASGTYVVTITDNTGCTATASQVVQFDNIAPTITCPANITLNNIANTCGAVATYVATATDNCPGAVSLSYSPTSGSTFAVGVNTVTVTATDVRGNTATCAFTVTVNDTQAPAILAYVTPPSPVSIDQLGRESTYSNVQLNGGGNVLTVAPGGFVNLTANWTSTYTDGGGCPACFTQHTIGINGVFSDCHGAGGGSGFINQSFFAPLTPGVYYIVQEATWWVFCGQFGTPTFQNNNANLAIAVLIVTGGGGGCLPNLVLNNDPGACGAVANFSADVSDNCPGATLSFSPANGSLFPVGTTTVTITASDTHSNTTTCTFTVTVNDTELPTIVCSGDISQLVDPGMCTANVTVPAPFVSDNCPGSVYTNSFNGTSDASGVYPTGTTLVVWTVTDAAGNQEFCFQNISVLDVNPPSIACPADIVVNNDLGVCGAVVNFAATATDDCSVPTITYSQDPGTVFATGTNVVTATATDASGNIAVCTFNITVNDTESPTFVNCPGDIFIDAAPGECGAVVTYDQPDGIDNCIPSGNGYAMTSIPYFGLYPPEASIPAGFYCDECQFGPFGMPFAFNYNNVPVSSVYVSTNGFIQFDAADGPGCCDGLLFPTGPAFANVVALGWGDWETDPTIDLQGVAPNRRLVFTWSGSEIACGGYMSGQIVLFEGTSEIQILNDFISVGCHNLTQGLNVGGVSEYTVPGRNATPFNVFSSDAWSFMPVNPTTPAVLQSGLASGSNFPIGTTTQVYTLTDPSGNVSSCFFSVTVNDAEAPTIVCPGNITMSSEVGVCGATVTFEATATDNCPGSVNIAYAPASGSVFPVGTTTVEAVAFDAFGNGATCYFDVTVIGSENPVIVCPGNLTVANDANSCGAVVAFNATATDNCPGVSLTYLPASGNFLPIGTTNVVATATDVEGNTATCSFNVTVQDTQGPVVNCPGPITVGSAIGTCGAVVNYTATASDNCPGIVSLAYLPASGSTFPVGTSSVLVTAMDGNGNTTTCSFTVTVTDAQAPSITCPGNITVNNDLGVCGATVNFATTASDNCGVPAVTYSTAPGTLFPIGTTVVTATATDASNNTATCSFSVTVNDTEAPSIVCPGPQSVILPNNCFMTFPDFRPLVTRSDNCGPVTLTQIPNPGNFAPGAGVVTVTMTASDASGNISTCSFTFTKIDNIPPTVTCPGDQTVVLDNACTGVLGDYTGLTTAVDNCFLGGATVTQSPAAGTPINGAGVTVVTMTATDGSGNTSTCSFNVNAVDPVAPSIACPGNITVINDLGVCGATVNFAATASDNCGVPAVTYSTAPGTLFPIGTTVVTATATDASNNTATCSFSVTVNDTEAPSIVCPGPQSVILPNNCFMTFPDFRPLVTRSDNCGPVTLTQIPNPGNFAPGAGVVTVTMTASDASGNISTCSFTFTKIDNIPPTVTCPGDQTVVLDNACTGVLGDYTGLTTAVDNCFLGGATVSQFPAAGTPINGAGVTVVVMTATDGSGNTSTCSFNVNAVDPVAPSIACPGNITVNNDLGVCGATVNFAATASDNCGVPAVTYSTAPGTLFPIGTTVVTATATDASNNTATCSFSVTVNDTEAPSIVCPGPQSIIMPNNCFITFPDFRPLVTRSDNCGPVTLTQIPNPGNFAPGAGVVTVTMTASDASGNISTCSFTFTKIDNIPPTVTCPGDQTVVLDNACTGVLGDYTGLTTAVDNCFLGGATVSQFPAAGTPINGAGVTVVVMTATDGSGNTSTCSFNVNAVDQTPPTVTCPATQGQSGFGQVLLADFSGAMIGADACGPVTYAQSPAIGTIYNTNQTVTVTMTASDASGNTATCSFDVVITITNCSPGSRLYVDDNPLLNGNNGSSWDNAFFRLESALAIAAPGTEIWVKEGTYYPTNTNDRSIFYALPPAVQLYGGFPQIADCNYTLLDRDPDLYLTTLSGDIGTPGVANDNSYSIMKAINVGGAGTVIDGFVFRDAYALTNVNTCALVINADGPGAQSSPELVNCVFSNNFNDLKGGAIYLRAYSGGVANPTFTNCDFTQNYAVGDGAVIFSTPKYGGSQINPTFDGCNFANNSTPSAGGVVYSWVYPLTSSTFSFNNCNFTNNSAGGNGGAIANVLRNDAFSTFNYSNCNFSGNQGDNGSAIFNSNVTGLSVNNYSTCVFNNNSAVDDGTVYSYSYKGSVTNTFNRVAFRNNAAVNGGGTYEYNTVAGPGVTTSYTNCVFYANAASANGGAVYALSRLSAPMSVNISFSTFYANTAVGRGGAIANINQSGINSMIIANNIVRGNPDGISRSFYTNGVGANSVVQRAIVDNTACATLNSGTGSFSCSGLNAQNPNFADAPNGDLHILAGSSAIDLAPTGPSVDYDGADRFIGVQYDLGAYEYGAILPRMAGTDAAEQTAGLTMKLFPNPTTDRFTIRLDRMVTGRVEVMDIEGRVIRSQEVEGAAQIDLAIGGRASGTYLVRLVTESSIIVQKIVLQQP